MLKFFFLLWVLLASSFVHAQTPMVRLAPLGYQQLTSTGLINLTVPTGATVALITVETTSVRWRDDGTAPTASVGNLLGVTGAGLPFTYTGNLSVLQFIPTASTSIVNVTYYRFAG
jgi:hypothetical protein